MANKAKSRAKTVSEKKAAAKKRNKKVAKEVSKMGLLKYVKKSK